MSTDQVIKRPGSLKGIKSVSLGRGGMGDMRIDTKLPKH